MLYSETAQAILLNIEGTLMPRSYVSEVLLPFVRDNVELFLEARGNDADVQADLALLRQDYKRETEPVPPWETGEDAIIAVPYLHHAITLNQPSKALQSIEEKIWTVGYQSGQIVSAFFVDVFPAFQRWTAARKSIYIFSSVGVQGQSLLFHYSKSGDLTPYISRYYDTTLGAKHEPESYRILVKKIATTISSEKTIEAKDILFISDSVAELQAAATIGIKGLLANRLNNHAANVETFTTIKDFSQM